MQLYKAWKPPTQREAEELQQHCAWLRAPTEQSGKDSSTRWITQLKQGCLTLLQDVGTLGLLPIQMFSTTYTQSNSRARQARHPSSRLSGAHVLLALTFQAASSDKSSNFLKIILNKFLYYFFVLLNTLQWSFVLHHLLITQIDSLKNIFYRKNICKIKAKIKRNKRYYTPLDSLHVSKDLLLSDLNTALN